jgi:hypothetical protein
MANDGVRSTYNVSDAKYGLLDCRQLKRGGGGTNDSEHGAGAEKGSVRTSLRRATVKGVRSILVVQRGAQTGPHNFSRISSMQCGALVTFWASLPAAAISRPKKPGGFTPPGFVVYRLSS